MIYIDKQFNVEQVTITLMSKDKEKKKENL